jgi:catechol 2,3-dioxygenase-like lactoylglutathione lyase family enzyme
MPVTGIDHVALPTADAERLLAFYKALGFACPDEDDWRAGRRPVFSIACGDHKVNVHPEGFVSPLRAPTATPGCGDLCFVWEGGLDALLATLDAAGATVEEGPVDRTGGRGGGSQRGVSVYVRDPDRNLVELLCYDAPPVGRV